MTSTFGTYSFLPWLRRGIAARITEQDGASTPVQRATVPVQLKLTGDPVAAGAAVDTFVDRSVQLFGPGDIVGIDARAIVRVEPREWITNFEPNYLAHIEFYDEDFPWRYTPAAPDDSKLRLRPWIALAVLEEGEFTEPGSLPGQPLPAISVLDNASLPPSADLWAWAHVHVNRSLAGSDAEFTTTETEAVLSRLTALLAENPDLAYSRLICPRRLKASAAYHAFIIPVFESGRLAGLGKGPEGAPIATAPAWGATGSTLLPYYHRWHFKTGTAGDFEYLVRLLERRPVDKKVGVRDFDVREPGAGLPAIDNLGGILRLGGALRVPRSSYNPVELAAVETYEQWAVPGPHAFQSALAAFVNLPDDYAAPVTAADPDPLITAPLYARWHALTQRLLLDRDGNRIDPADNWVHQLNLDPRHRLAAGFGTRVVREHQEEYMQAAWEQIGEVLAANRRIREAQVAMQVATVWHEELMVPLAAARPERALVLTAPVQSRVRDGAFTVRHERSLSLLVPTYTSVAMRRATRPGARLITQLPFDGVVRPDNLLGRVNSGEVSAAPPKVTPPGVVTTDEVADALTHGIPGTVRRALVRYPWLVWVPLLLAFIVALLVVLLVTAGVGGASLVAGGAVIVALLILLWLLLRRWVQRIAQAGTIRPSSHVPSAVDTLPKSPDFVVTPPGSGFVPTQGGSDSEQAKRFKDALRHWYRLHRASGESAAQPDPVPLDIPGLASTVVGAIDPKITVPARTWHGISLPAHVAEQLDLSDFGEVMAYPEIDVPMYDPLKRLSDELFLPNLSLIGHNTISLLETNQEFIEAYMVGVNHEMARELLWREYPTDQRGTPFRQFWDARGALTPPGLTADQRKELLRDIQPLNRWLRRSHLKEHDNRETDGKNAEDFVLCIRGELLKKYPNAVIYAQKAVWAMSGANPDPSQERTLVDILESEANDPPPAKLKSPLYEAKVDPDITFLGFDLTIEEARGDESDTPDAGKPGWFFVIKERPGEPRMGFDTERTGPLQTVNDFAWSDIATAEHRFIAPGVLAVPLPLEPLGQDDGEKKDQHADDLAVADAPVSAARWAYLLYQAPVMVAVHATEMLPDPNA